MPTSSACSKLNTSLQVKKRAVVLRPFSIPSISRTNALRKQNASTAETDAATQKGKDKSYAIPFCYPSMAIRFPEKVETLFGHKNTEPYICIFFSGNDRPLDIWDKQIRGGSVKRVADIDQEVSVLEITGKSPLTFIIAPICPTHSLGIQLPYVALDVKNLYTFFEYHVEILDNSNVRRVFKFNTTATTAKIAPMACTVPCKLVKGWNHLIFNLAKMTRTVFKTGYKETVRVQVHANCRLRRVYFCDSPDGFPSHATHMKNLRKTKKAKDGNTLDIVASHSAIQFPTVEAGAGEIQQPQQ